MTDNPVLAGRLEAVIRALRVLASTQRSDTAQTIAERGEAVLAAGGAFEEVLVEQCTVGDLASADNFEHPDPRIGGSPGPPQLTQPIFGGPATADTRAGGAACDLTPRQLRFALRPGAHSAQLGATKARSSRRDE